MKLFLGTHEHSLDEKGRLSLPVRFREFLQGKGDGRLIVTTNVDPDAQCLVAYPADEWQTFQEKVYSLPQFDEHVIRLKRLHIAGAAECTPDKNGRILIPQTLRDYASLKDSTIFAGLGNNIEIWDKGAWEHERKRAKEKLGEINDALARFGL